MANSKNSNTFTIDLHLDEDDDDDAIEEHPRRLLKIQGDWVAYGGNFGNLVRVPTLTSSSASSSAKATVVRQTEDAIRTVAVNASGTRVVVGSDAGDTHVYVYDNQQPQESDSEGHSTSHPFVALPEGAAGSQEDKDIMDDSLLSQSDHPPRRKETVWTAVADDSAMRDYVWLDEMTLACASEAHWFWIDCSTETSTLTKHIPDELDSAHGGSGIRSLAVNADKTVLVSLSMDGRACWWQKQGKDWKLLHRESSKCVTLNDVGEINGSSPWSRSTRPIFVTQTIVALPGAPFVQLRRWEEGRIEKYDPLEQENGSKEQEGVQHQGHLQAIVTMETRDGYLVTSGLDGRVIVWDIEESKQGVEISFVRLLREYKSAPTDLAWDVDDQGEESLLIACANGQLVTIRGRDNIAPVRVRSKASELVVSASSTTTTDDKPMESTASTTSGSKPAVTAGTTATRTSPRSLQKKKAGPPRVDSDVDDDAIFAAASPPGSAVANAAPKTNRFVDDQAAEDNVDDDDDDDSLGRGGKGKGGGPSAFNSPLGGGRDYDSEDDDDDMDREGQYYPPPPPTYHLPKLPEPQAPFAPSSTPLDLTRRFLCWNHIGSVTRLQGEPGMSRTLIDIDFTDSAFKRPISFTDTMGFVLGSLGEDGGIFCTDIATEDHNEVDEYMDRLNMSEATKAAIKKQQKSRMKDVASRKPTGSTIYFHRFASFGNIREKDWHLTLPNDERVLGSACGEGWAAVMTSRRFLRLFSSGGNQGQILWLPGEPLTMTGRSRFLFVVYHEAMPLSDGTQKLGYLFMDAVSSRLIHKGPVACVSKASSLTWIGFSNDHSVIAMDSDGMLSMLVYSGSASDIDASMSNWEWVPMLDTVGLRKSVDDNFWPITVYDGKLVCVPLKGGTQHPDATRRPVTTSLPFRMPLARGLLAKTNALEELSVRAGIALNQKKALHDVVLGAEDEEFDNEYHVMSAQVDKVTLKMFAGIVEAGKLERALDLVERLHLEKSYDLAMTIADNHRKLVDRIEEAKDRRFRMMPQDYGFDQTGDNDDHDNDQEFPSRISTDSIFGRKRSMPDEGKGVSRMIRRKDGVA